MRVRSSCDLIAGHLASGLAGALATVLVLAIGCGGDGGGAEPDAPVADPDAAPPDGPAASGLGAVTGVTELAMCPAGAPAGATCKQVTVTGCPGLETEPIDAIVAIRAPAGADRGTVVHFSGGGGRGFQGQGASYTSAGFRTIQVAWATDWEQTQTLGIKAAGCRPATLLKWIFDEPSLHAGSRAAAFCGEGFSGGSGQLGYALAHYGMADYLDYVNELSGPPFARIDLGCDGSAPATAVVCGATDTMRLPPQVLNAWENIQPPLMCGSQNVPAAELARWRDDSIASGGVYDYPKTRVEFYACTNNATAVTAMGKLYFDLISAAAGGNSARAGYHCYSAADGCQGENLGTGNADAVSSLIANCVPRHQ
jgi:hypothetical protein